MPAASPPIVLAAAIYFAVVLAIGVWSARRTRTARDFFIAGQGLGVVVTGLATMSAAFSGFVFVGGPGLTYRLGLASLFIAISVGFTGALLCWTVGKRLRLLSEVREVFTVPDALLHRFGSRRTAGWGAVAVLVGTVGYLGAQFQALGILLESLFGTREALGAWSLPLMMAIGVAVVVFYSTAGGMVAGVWTDAFQGTLMVGAATAVFAYALHAGGGLSAMARSIAGSEAFGADFLDPMSGLPVLTAAGFFFVFAVGPLGQPHMLHKFYMLRDPLQLKWLPMILGVTQALCLLIWLGIGMAVPALVAEGRLAALADPDLAAPTFLLSFVPELLAGVVFAGILAAIMSTADSFVNIASAALVRDLPRALGWRVSDELTWGRLAVVAVAIGAALFAWAYGDLVALLGTFAFGTFGAALAPALAVGLNWKRVPAAAASASIVVGMGLNLVLEFLGRQTLFPSLPESPLPPGVPPTAASLAASFTVLFLVTVATRSCPPMDADIEAVLEA